MTWRRQQNPGRLLRQAQCQMTLEETLAKFTVVKFCREVKEGRNQVKHEPAARGGQHQSSRVSGVGSR